MAKNVVAISNTSSHNFTFLDEFSIRYILGGPALANAFQDRINRSYHFTSDLLVGLLPLDAVIKIAGHSNYEEYR